MDFLPLFELVDGAEALVFGPDVDVDSFVDDCLSDDFSAVFSLDFPAESDIVEDALSAGLARESFW